MGGGGLQTLSQIDFYVKKMVLEDSIKLAKKKKETIASIDKFNSLTRILPFLDNSSAASYLYQTLTKVRTAYLMLAPIKSKATLTSSNFEKIIGKSRSLPMLMYDSKDLSLMF
jgi:hypothetical protein